MKTKAENRILFLFAVLVALAAAGIFLKNSWKSKAYLREVSVVIEGRVARPGAYRFPYGTTRFEILRVAGVQTDSDIKGLDLYAQAADGEKINVGKLDKEIAVKPGGGENLLELVFSTGNVSIVKKGGAGQGAKPGTALAEGDRVVTGPDGLAELKAVDGTVVDLQQNSSFEPVTLYKGDDKGVVGVQFRLSQGRFWSSIRQQPENVRFSFITPHLLAQIRGTEIEISVDNISSKISVIQGTVLASRPDGSGEANLGAGNSAEFFNEAAKPPQVGSFDQAARAADPTLKKFNEEKEKFMSKAEVIRMLYFALPIYYLIFEFDRAAGTATIYRVPTNLPLGDLINGVEEFGKAYLYGGIDLSRSVLERMAGKRIKYYLVQGKDDVALTFDEMGGVPVKVDGAAAELLKTKPGLQTLDGKKLLLYMSSQSDGSAASAVERQNQVMGAVMEKLKGSTFSAALLMKIFSSGQTNIDVNYAVSAHAGMDNKGGMKVKVLNFTPAVAN